MKKIITLILVVVMVLSLASCGGKNTDSTDGTSEGTDNDASYSEENTDSIDSKWEGTDNGDSYYVYIEDGRALMEFFEDTYTGVVDEENKTITFTYTRDGETKETILDYETIGGKLVLTRDSEKNPGMTSDVYSYTRVE